MKEYVKEIEIKFLSALASQTLEYWDSKELNHFKSFLLSLK